jgi:hypothetical protein
MESRERAGREPVFNQLTQYFHGAGPRIEAVTTQSLAYNNGALLTLQFQPVFWGPNVSADIADPQNGIVATIQRIVNKANLQYLSQYDVAGQGLIENSTAASSSITVSSALPPLHSTTSVTFDDVGEALHEQVDAGALPDPHGSTVYVVYMPASVTVSYSPSGCGAHGVYYTTTSSPFEAPYIVISDPSTVATPCTAQGLSHYQQVTETTAHEIIETLTDPYPTSGWDGPGGGQDEIGDKCNTNSATVLGRDGVRDYAQLEWLNSVQPASGGGCAAGQNGAYITAVSTFPGGVATYWSTFDGMNSPSCTQSCPQGGIASSWYGPLQAPQTGWGWTGPVELSCASGGPCPAGTSGSVEPGSPIAAAPTFNDSSVNLYWATSGLIDKLAYKATGGGWGAIVPAYNSTAIPTGAPVVAINSGLTDGSVWFVSTDNAGRIVAGFDTGNNILIFSSRRGIAPPSAAISAASTKPGGLSLFWVDASGGIQTAYYDCHNPTCNPATDTNGTWDGGISNNFALEADAGAPPGSPVPAVSNQPGGVSVFWTLSNGTIWTKWFSNGGWTPGVNAGADLLYGPGTISGYPANPGTLSAVSTPTTSTPGNVNTVNLFWSAQDPAGDTVIQTGWWDPVYQPYPQGGWWAAVTVASPGGLQRKNPYANPNTLVTPVNNQSDRQVSLFWEGAGGATLTAYAVGGYPLTWSAVGSVAGWSNPASPVP